MGAYFVNIPQPRDGKPEPGLRFARQPDGEGVVAKAGRRVQVNINGTTLALAGVKRCTHHQIQLPVESFIHSASAPNMEGKHLLVSIQIHGKQRVSER